LIETTRDVNKNSSNPIQFIWVSDTYNVDRKGLWVYVFVTIITKAMEQSPLVANMRGYRKVQLAVKWNGGICERGVGTPHDLCNLRSG